MNTALSLVLSCVLGWEPPQESEQFYYPVEIVVDSSALAEKQDADVSEVSGIIFRDHLAERLEEAHLSVVPEGESAPDAATATFVVRWIDFEAVHYGAEVSIETPSGERMTLDPFGCPDCTERGLVEAFAEQRLSDFLAAVETPAPSGPLVKEPSPPQGEGETPPSLPEQPSKALRPAGYTMIGVGLSATVAGAVLLARSSDQDPSSGQPRSGTQPDRTPLGAALLGSGLAVVVGGSALLIVHRLKKKKYDDARVSFAPSFSASQAGLVLTGRF